VTIGELARATGCGIGIGGALCNFAGVGGAPKAFVESQTRRGYSTPSEYIRELIRSDRKQKEREQLDSLLVDGLHSGNPIPIDARF